MKTIDVMEGDTWTKFDDDIFQYRRSQFRALGKREMRDWRDGDKGEIEEQISERVAQAYLLDWGYTLTPAAKPEAKPKPLTFMDDLVERTEKAKPADVPVVDAVWAEVTWSDGVKVLNPYPSLSDAEKTIGSMHPRDKAAARIVRLRHTDAEARDAADGAIRLHQNLKQRVVDLESRLAALEKPADKDAAYVKAMRDRIKTLEDACREFVRFANLPKTVDRGDYIRYQIRAISAAENALENPLSTPESEAVDDGHSQTDKCGPDCTLEVLRPGQVQCNRDGAKCPNRNDNGTERKGEKR